MSYLALQQTRISLHFLSVSSTLKNCYIPLDKRKSLNISVTMWLKNFVIQVYYSRSYFLCRKTGLLWWRTSLQTVQFTLLPFLLSLHFFLFFFLSTSGSLLFFTMSFFVDSAVWHLHQPGHYIAFMIVKCKFISKIYLYYWMCLYIIGCEFNNFMVKYCT